MPIETVQSLDLALKAVNSALAKCEEGGYRVSVAVVDRGGLLELNSIQPVRLQAS